MTASPFGGVVLCGISIPFGMLSPAQRQITHVLLTRAPLYRGRSPFSCDLHVLGAPLTFVLSQDQTLQLNFWKPQSRPKAQTEAPEFFGDDDVITPLLPEGKRHRRDSSDPTEVGSAEGHFYPCRSG